MRVQLLVNGMLIKGVEYRTFEVVDYDIPEGATGEEVAKLIGHLGADLVQRVKNFCIDSDSFVGENHESLYRA